MPSGEEMDWAYTTAPRTCTGNSWLLHFHTSCGKSQSSIEGSHSAFKIKFKDISKTTFTIFKDHFTNPKQHFL